MLVVADVNITQGEVNFLREVEFVERVVCVPQDLYRSMPDEQIVEYVLENEDIVVTRDKATTLESSRSRTILQSSSSGIIAG